MPILENYSHLFSELPDVLILYGEALNKVSVLVFDKTGTLTKGVFEVANIIQAAGYQKEQVLEYAAQAESYSNHPIAKSILATYGKPIDQKQFSDFEEISGHGISVMVQGKKVLACLLYTSRCV